MQVRWRCWGTKIARGNLVLGEGPFAAFFFSGLDKEADLRVHSPYRRSLVSRRVCFSIAPSCKPMTEGWEAAAGYASRISNEDVGKDFFSLGHEQNLLEIAQIGAADLQGRVVFRFRPSKGSSRRAGRRTFSIEAVDGTPGCCKLQAGCVTNWRSQRRSAGHAAQFSCGKVHGRHHVTAKSSLPQEWP